jgi:hypothetical protein
MDIKGKLVCAVLLLVVLIGVCQAGEFLHGQPCKHLKLNPDEGQEQASVADCEACCKENDLVMATSYNACLCKSVKPNVGHSGCPCEAGEECDCNHDCPCRSGAKCNCGSHE